MLILAHAFVKRTVERRRMHEATFGAPCGANWFDIAPSGIAIFVVTIVVSLDMITGGDIPILG